MIKIPVKAGSEGRLYGSVTAADVAAGDRRRRPASSSTASSSPSTAIKATGEHTVTAKLHSDVEFPITLEVVAAAERPSSPGRWGCPQLAHSEITGLCP